MGKAKASKETVMIVGNRITYPDGTYVETDGHEVRFPGCEPIQVTEQNYREWCSVPASRVASLWSLELPAEKELEIIRSMLFYGWTGEIPTGISLTAQTWTRDFAVACSDESRSKGFASMCQKRGVAWKKQNGGDDAETVDKVTGEVCEQPPREQQKPTPLAPPRSTTSSSISPDVRTLFNGREVKYNDFTGEWNDTKTGERIDIVTGDVIDSDVPF